jgi:hypothetical protein
MNKYFICLEIQTYNIIERKFSHAKISSIVKAETIEQAIENMKTLLPQNTKHAIVICATFIEREIEINILPKKPEIVQ